jgi:hypothetical protein
LKYDRSTEASGLKMLLELNITEIQDDKSLLKIITSICRELELRWIQIIFIKTTILMLVE